MSRIVTGAGLVVALWFLAVPVALHAQEATWGGEAAVLPSVTLSPRLDEIIMPRVRAEHTAIIGVYGDRADLDVELDAWYEMTGRLEGSLAASGVSLSTLKISAAPASWLTVELGRFSDPTGLALVASPNDYYTASSLDALLRGDLQAGSEPETLVSATFFVPRVQITTTFMPIPEVPELVEAGSFWTPRLPIDRVIDDPQIAPDPVTLGEVYSEATRRIDEPYRRVSGGARAAATFGPVDATLHFFHGVDPSPVPRARIDFPLAPIHTYDLYLAPEETVIDSFGLASEAVVDRATVWLDTAFVPEKTVSTTRIDPYSKRSRLETMPSLSAVLGSRLDLPAANLNLVAEYHFVQLFAPPDVDPDALVTSPLANDLVAVANLRLGRERAGSVTVAGVASFDDASGVVSLALGYEPSPAFTMGLRAPVFLGATDSDFGQYRDVIHVISEIRYRY